MGNSINLDSNIKLPKMDSTSGSAALFEYATEGILVANEQGFIIKANPAAEKLLGYEKNELLKLKVEDLVPQRFAGRHGGNREQYNKSPHARKMGSGLDLYAKRKDGSEFPVE